MLDGAAGIGKSTLWQAAVESARDQGIRALVSRPVQAEARLTYVGLADLLVGVEDAVLATLPPPQRRALEAALLRVDAPAGTGTRQRIVATAFLSVLRALAAGGRRSLA